MSIDSGYKHIDVGRYCRSERSSANRIRAVYLWSDTRLPTLPTCSSSLVTYVTGDVEVQDVIHDHEFLWAALLSVNMYTSKHALKVARQEVFPENVSDNTSGIFPRENCVKRTTFCYPACTCMTSWVPAFIFPDPNSYFVSIIISAPLSSIKAMSSDALFNILHLTIMRLNSQDKWVNCV